MQAPDSQFIISDAPSYLLPFTAFVLSRTREMGYTAARSKGGPWIWDEKPRPALSISFVPAPREISL
jgi:hypothetical protein